MTRLLRSFGVRIEDLVARRDRRGIRDLLRHEDDALRREAVRVLANRHQQHLARGMVDLLLNQGTEHEHDLAYDAAHSLDGIGLRVLERIALEERRARKHAIACIGSSRCGRGAVACLRRITRKTGLGDEAMIAVYNLQHAAGLSLAARGLESRDAETLSYAMMAIVQCLRSASPRERTRRRPVIQRLIMQVAQRKELHTETSDPWISTAAWIMDALALMRAPCLLPLAKRLSQQAKDRDVREDARQALRLFDKL